MQSSRLFKRTLTVPFSISELAGGLAEANGLASLTSEGVKLDWETSETLFGSKMSKGSVTIPLDEIVAVELKRSWYFWYALQIQTESLDSVSAVPSSKQGKVSVTVSRSHFEEAKRFVVALNQTIMEQDIHLLDDELRLLRDDPETDRRLSD
jgi:hypothetical protein